MADGDTDSDEARYSGHCRPRSALTAFAFGARAGQKVFTLQGAMPQDGVFAQAQCADLQGFSLHGAVRCAAHERKRLEQLCRYNN